MLPEMIDIDPILDALRYVNKLKAAGIPDRQAQVLVETLKIVYGTGPKESCFFDSFDILQYANKLKAIGVPEKQAEAQAEVVAEIVGKKSAAKKWK